MKSKTSEQRTKYIFEDLDYYPKPPLISENAFDELQALKNAEPTFSHLLILKSYLFLSNYKSFRKNISQNMEEILRISDYQSGALFSPVISATLMLKDDCLSKDPIDRAARLILGARKFYTDLVEGKLEPDKYNDQVLEMGQYLNCFSTSQVIYKKNAKIFKSMKTSRILVIVNKTYFLVEIGDVNKEISYNNLKEVLTKIVKNSKNNSNSESYLSPGLLTSAKTHTQIKIFNKLKQIKENQISLDEIKHSFLVLCLDLDKFPSIDAEASKIAHVGNPSNRWFHSSFQFVVFGNSKTSIIMNFSNSISGNVMMRTASEIYKRSIEVKETVLDINNERFRFIKLPWKINKKQIDKAQKDFANIRDRQQACYEINSVGKNYFDLKKINVISVFVIALQIAFRNLMKKDANITQFVSLSKYRYLDLVTANVTTKENLNFIDELDSDNFSKNEKLKLLKSAISSQRNEIRKARKTFTIIDQILYQMDFSKGLFKIYLKILVVIILILLRLSGFFKKKGREIIISHPRIFDEVTIVGRPGVKISYARYFGLHYQIFEGKIVITMMPGVNWKIPNKQIINELERSLLKVIQIIG